MKKPTTESLRREISKREWDAKSKGFKRMLGKFFKRDGEKGHPFDMFNRTRTPDFPQFFHPMKIAAARGLIERTPAIEGEWFSSTHDGNRMFYPKHSEFWDSDWSEISRAEYEKAWADFCHSISDLRK